MEIEILLYKLRTEKGYSARKLADKSGISKSQINDIENGKKSPTLNTLKKLADALDCRIEDLYTYK